MSFQLSCVQNVRCEYERAYPGLYFERHSFKKHINYLKFSVNAHMKHNSVTFPKLFMIYFFRTFPGLEITNLQIR